MLAVSILTSLQHVFDLKSNRMGDRSHWGKGFVQHSPMPVYLVCNLQIRAIKVEDSESVFKQILH